MRFFKLFLISIVVIALLLVVFSMVLPSHVRISRAIDIKAPTEKIQSYISRLEDWRKWNALLNDPAINFISADSQHIKTNRFDIYLRAVKTDSVHTLWIQPDGKAYNSQFAFTSSAGVTVVQWYFDFHFRWPWEKFGSLVYDQQMGPGMEKSLTELQRLVETSP
ncbi:MAG: SRPBCC family protein [Chitinophagaceae bacterium]